MFGNMLVVLLAAVAAVQAQNNTCTVVSNGQTRGHLVHKCVHVTNPLLTLGKSAKEVLFKIPNTNLLGVSQVGATVKVCDESGLKPHVQFNAYDEVCVTRGISRFKPSAAVATVDVFTYCQVIGSPHRTGLAGHRLRKEYRVYPVGLGD